MKPTINFMKAVKITFVLWILTGLAWLAMPLDSAAQTVIGSWQTSSDDGWIDWGNGLSITDAANTGVYSFVSGAVPGYGQSLQINQSGNHQNLAIKLEYLPGGVAAFLTNHLLSFTFSIPSSESSGATAGFSQLYQIAINASGYGFNAQTLANVTAIGSTNDNQSGQPNYYFYPGAAARSQTVTLNYSNILSSITATPSSGYIEIIFSFNNGGGAPANYFINDVNFSGGSGIVVTNPPPSPPTTNGVVIGSWQGAGSSLTNSLDEGWIDWGNGFSIGDSTNSAVYGFVAGAVSGYGQSLQINQSGFHQNLAIKLQYLPGGVQAFLTNHLLNFTFSVPAAGSSTAGYSQLFGIALNTSGYGYHDQGTNQFSSTGWTTNNSGWQPNFNFYAGAPARSQVVTLDYSNILASVTATPTNGYVEIIFSFNNGGGAPANYFINDVTLSGGPVTIVSNPPPAPSTVIGSWQGTGSALTNSLDEGWIDWGNGFSITDAANTAVYGFVASAVSGYGQSLQINQSGYHQNLAIKLENLPGGMAAFLTNHLLNFTFSVPGTAGNAGFSQLYALSINANGYGFHDQEPSNFSATGNTNNNSAGHNGLPNFYFSNNGPAQSQVVTLDYSSILPTIAASNTVSSGYIEIIFAFNNGSGGPANYFINNVNLSGGPAAGVTNPPQSTDLFTFTLLNGPSGSSLNSSNGLFTWRPLVSQANTTNLVTVKVTENFAPNLSATNSYSVIVNPLTPTVISSFTVSGGQPALTVTGTQGPDYTVLTSTNLVNWQPLFTTNSPVLPLTISVGATTNTAQFFRIQAVP
jgi:hypothetical protein